MKRVFCANEAAATAKNGTPHDTGAEHNTQTTDSGTMHAPKNYTPSAHVEKQTACVVIPVYKETLSQNELRSLRRCFSVLKNHPIFLATHARVDLNRYKTEAEKFAVSVTPVFFSARFFESTRSYNHLMKSLNFYRAFSRYEYMLIYQLDAWVFRDELKAWCARGYDYIGAPWTRGDKAPSAENPFVLSGNGGFSLRRVNYFTNVLSTKGRIFTQNGIHSQIERAKTDYANAVNEYGDTLGCEKAAAVSEKTDHKNAENDSDALCTYSKNAVPSETKAESDTTLTKYGDTPHTAKINKDADIRTANKNTAAIHTKTTDSENKVANMNEAGESAAAPTWSSPQTAVLARIILAKKRLVLWCKIIGYKTGFLNRMCFLRHSAWTEDQFWIENFAKGGTFFPMRVPAPAEAQFFAFEQFPSYLYEQTAHMLPFGAHAWHRFEYESFWRTHLQD